MVFRLWNYLAGCSCFTRFLSFVAIVLLVLAIVRAIRVLVFTVRWTLFTSRTNLKKYGNWAMITGTTSGIGESLAKKLGAAGINVYMIARNQAALEKLAAEIRAQSKVEVRTAVADLSADNIWPTISQAVAEFKTLCQASGGKGIVINNAGLSYEHATWFANVDEKQHRDLVGVNCRFLVSFSREVLPAISNGGLLLNVSSLLGCLPSPLLATYSASKDFVNNFTVALREECKRKPGCRVTVQALLPGFVSTKMSKMKPSFTCPASDAYADCVLAKLGQGPAMFVPHPAHYLAYVVLKCVPTALSRYVIWSANFSTMQRAEKKKAREAANK